MSTLDNLRGDRDAIHGTIEHREGAPGDGQLGRSMVATMICEQMNRLENSQERTIIDSEIGNSLKADEMVRFEVRRQSQLSGFRKLTSRIKMMHSGMKFVLIVMRTIMVAFITVRQG
jgi:hypothetical protein